MIKEIKTLIFTVLFISACLSVSAQDKPAVRTLPITNYYIKGNSLQHFYKVITIQKKATVTFLGGSITYNPGWRQKICQYFQEHFPDVKFHFIAAGIPSLGSLPHAFRLQRDVLDSGKTDLMFIETVVNDRVNGTDSITQIRDLEGIVRHAKRSNPNMDMVLMAFADPDKTRDYDNGIVPVEIENQQKVAQHYNLAFINQAKDVRDKIANKEIVWATDFKDIHPAPFGQELYFATIKSFLQDCFSNQPKNIDNKRVLPSPLDKANFENGEYYNIKNARYEKGWSITENWKPTDGLATRDGFVNVPVLSANKPGAELSLPFTGNAVGIAIISGSDAGIINYSIDNSPEKSIDLYTQWSSFLHLPWYVLLGSDLNNGKHILKVKISSQKNTASKGNACQIVNFLVNGSH